MPQYFTVGYVANGNISPRRFLTTVSGAANILRVVQASAATNMLVGISQNVTRNVPGSPGDDGYVAIAGETVPYHGPGERCLLDIGGTVDNAGVPLTSDGSGKGVATAPADGSTRTYGALALESGVNGDTIEVVVLAYTPTV